MTTRIIMKARIAADLARSDLTTEIGEAITTAIEIYQTERFWFNEGRSNTFTTVATQRIYTTSDATWIPDVLALDFLTLEVSSTDIRFLDQVTPEIMEDQSGNTSSSGQPTDYSYLDQSIYLYPVPSSAWTVRMTGHVLKAEPASDSEASNVWMVEAERLIRSRAKYEIAIHVTRNSDLAIANSPNSPPPGAPGGYEAFRSFERLRGRTNRQVGSGKIRPYS